MIAKGRPLKITQTGKSAGRLGEVSQAPDSQKVGGPSLAGRDPPPPRPRPRPLPAPPPALCPCPEIITSYCPASCHRLGEAAVAPCTAELCWRHPRTPPPTAPTPQPSREGTLLSRRSFLCPPIPSLHSPHTKVQAGAFQESAPNHQS